MKVVILAGGLGTRMREETEFRPKPMVDIGGKPVLWHIMKLYAHHQHTEFIILAGYKSEMIKEYFYNYLANNLDLSITLGNPGSARFHGSHDEFDWRVTVVDTGKDTPTGGRIWKAREHIGDEPFLCTYGDGVSNVDISALAAAHKASGKIATLTSTKPMGRFGVLEIDEKSVVRDFKEKPQVADSVNIGFFLFAPEIFDYLSADSVLEEEPLHSLSSEGQLMSFQHEGFWQPMDTYREYQSLNELWQKGAAPWAVWESSLA